MICRLMDVTVVAVVVYECVRYNCLQSIKGISVVYYL